MAKTKKVVVPNIPAYRLARALVGRVESETLGRDLGLVADLFGHKTTEKVKQYAATALALCAKDCHFCGRASAAVPKGKEISWSTVTLCACLNQYRTEDIWHREVRGPEDLLKIWSDVVSGVAMDYEPILSRRCAAYHRDAEGTAVRCNAPFELTAGSVARGVKAVLQVQSRLDLERRREPRSAGEMLREFKWSTKCFSCRKEARARLGADEYSSSNAAPKRGRKSGDKAAAPAARKAV